MDFKIILKLEQKKNKYGVGLNELGVGGSGDPNNFLGTAELETGLEGGIWLAW